MRKYADDDDEVESDDGGGIDVSNSEEEEDNEDAYSSEEEEEEVPAVVAKRARGVTSAKSAASKTPKNKLTVSVDKRAAGKQRGKKFDVTVASEGGSSADEAMPAAPKIASITKALVPVRQQPQFLSASSTSASQQQQQGGPKKRQLPSSFSQALLTGTASQQQGGRRGAPGQDRSLTSGWDD